jgi:hypothetical protein
MPHWDDDLDPDLKDLDDGIEQPPGSVDAAQVSMRWSALPPEPNDGAVSTGVTALDRPQQQ